MLQSRQGRTSQLTPTKQPHDWNLRQTKTAVTAKVISPWQPCARHDLDNRQQPLWHKHSQASEPRGILSRCLPLDLCLRRKKHLPLSVKLLTHKQTL